MASIKPKKHLATMPEIKKTGRKKKVSEPTQHMPMQRVLVLKNGRRKVLEWHPWK